MVNEQPKLETANPIPLTPAEQVQRIRAAVSGRGTASDGSGVGLSAGRLYLDTLRNHISEVETQMFVHEYPFESHAPLVGKLIVWIRTIWNWMSAKWYVLPMLQQQNRFNAAAAQSLRDVAVINETLIETVNQLQARVYQLEQELARQNLET